MKQTMSIGLALLLCLNVTAAWTITEIHANPQGSDSGREWVKLQGEPLPADARFFEDGGTHGLSLAQGNCEKNCEIVIADVAHNVIAEHDFDQRVLVYDSSWSSLRNTGETIGLLIGDVIVAEATYETLADGEYWQAPQAQEEKQEETTTEVPEFGTLAALVMLATIGLVVARQRTKH